MSEVTCGCGGNLCGDANYGEAVEEKVVDLEAPDAELASEGVAEFVRCIEAMDDAPAENRGAEIARVMAHFRKQVELVGKLAIVDAAAAAPKADDKAARVYREFFKSLLIVASAVAISAGIDPAAAALESLSELADLSKTEAEKKAAG